MLKPIWIIVTWAVGLNQSPGDPRSYGTFGLSPTLEETRPFVSSWLDDDKKEAPSAFYSEDDCKRALGKLLADRRAGGGTYVYALRTECMRARIKSDD